MFSVNQRIRSTKRVLAMAYITQTNQEPAFLPKEGIAPTQKTSRPASRCRPWWSRIKMRPNNNPSNQITSFDKKENTVSFRFQTFPAPKTSFKMSTITSRAQTKINKLPGKSNLQRNNHHKSLNLQKDSKTSLPQSFRSTGNKTRAQ